MYCKRCFEQFRTREIPKGDKMVCYHCGFDNGIKARERGVPE